MKWDLSIKQTKTKFIPVADCPNKKCGLKDTPLSFSHSIYKQEKTGKELDVKLLVCPKCDTIVNFNDETWKSVKGYISEQDLLDAGYTKDE